MQTIIQINGPMLQESSLQQVWATNSAKPAKPSAKQVAKDWERDSIIFDGEKFETKTKNMDQIATEIDTFLQTKNLKDIQISLIKKYAHQGGLFFGGFSMCQELLQSLNTTDVFWSIYLSDTSLSYNFTTINNGDILLTVHEAISHCTKQHGDKNSLISHPFSGDFETFIQSESYKNDARQNPLANFTTTIRIATTGEIIYQELKMESHNDIFSNVYENALKKSIAKNSDAKIVYQAIATNYIEQLKQLFNESNYHEIIAVISAWSTAENAIFSPYNHLLSIYAAINQAVHHESNETLIQAQNIINELTSFFDCEIKQAQDVGRLLTDQNDGYYIQKNISSAKFTRYLFTRHGTIYEYDIDTIKKAAELYKKLLSLSHTKDNGKLVSLVEQLIPRLNQDRTLLVKTKQLCRYCGYDLFIDKNGNFRLYPLPDELTAESTGYSFKTTRSGVNTTIINADVIIKQYKLTILNQFPQLSGIKFNFGGQSQQYEALQKMQDQVRPPLSATWS